MARLTIRELKSIYKQGYWGNTTLTKKNKKELRSAIRAREAKLKRRKKSVRAPILFGGLFRGY